MYWYHIILILIGSVTSLSQFADELHLDFTKDKIENRLLQAQGLRNAITQTADGILISPSEQPEIKMTGYSLLRHLEGDFEIVSSFEVKELTTPSSSRGAGFRIDFSSADTKAGGGIARLVTNKGAYQVRCVESTLRDEGKRSYKFQSVPAGKGIQEFTFKVVRSGDQLTYFWISSPSDKPPSSRLVSKTTYNKEKISELKFRLQHGGGEGSATVIWKSLHIKASKIFAPVTTALTYDGKTIQGEPVELKNDSITFSGDSDQPIHLMDLTEIRFPRRISTLRATQSGAVQIELGSGNQLIGKVEAFSDSSLTLNVDASVIRIPLISIRHLAFGPIANGLAKRITQLSAAELETDSVLVRRPDATLTEVAGTVLGMADGKLEFEYEGETRKISVDRLAAIVFATNPLQQKHSGPYQTVRLTDGGTLSGKITGLTKSNLTLTLLWHQDIQIPFAKIGVVFFLNGRMVYLSDREPSEVEEKPYFGRVLSYRRDESLDGKELAIRSKTFRKGLAVHSYSRLAYSLNGEFAQFRATVGFDRSLEPLGDVKCRVLTDGKPVFERRLRAIDEPVSVLVDLNGANTLDLEVDFGELEDTGDRIIWGDAAVLRARPSQ